MPRSDNWSRQLPRPVIVKGGDALRRLSDCRAYNPIPGRFTAQLCKFPQKENSTLLGCAETSSIFRCPDSPQRPPNKKSRASHRTALDRRPVPTRGNPLCKAVKYTRSLHHF
jgi:hypothetical protein